MKYGNVNFCTNSINITEIWNDRHHGKCHNRSYKKLYLWRFLWKFIIQWSSVLQIYIPLLVTLNKKTKKITNLLRLSLKSGQPNFRKINFLSVTWNIILSIAKGFNFKNCMKSVINCNFLIFRKSWHWCSQKTEQSRKDKLNFHLQW